GRLPLRESARAEPRHQVIEIGRRLGSLPQQRDHQEIDTEHHRHPSSAPEPTRSSPPRRADSQSTIAPQPSHHNRSPSGFHSPLLPGRPETVHAAPRPMTLAARPIRAGPPDSARAPISWPVDSPVTLLIIDSDAAAPETECMVARYPNDVAACGRWIATN